MVTCKLTGRFGNNLFQVAATIATALRNNDEYLIPHYTRNNTLWPFHEHLKRLPQFTDQRVRTIYKEEPDFKFKPIQYSPDMCLDGYWQSELHFKDYRDEIIKALDIPKMPMGLVSDFVSIHIRRGDFVTHADKFPPVTLKYINQAIEVFPKNTEFMVFSDDIAWCKENLPRTFFFSENDDLFQDFFVMSSCASHIIANSTYSWMAAWLNDKPGKVVVSPSKYNWFGKGNSHLSTDYIIPNDWIQIKY